MLSTLCKNSILQATHSSHILNIEVIQELWSGYGILAKVHLDSQLFKSVIVKNVQVNLKEHPRGWNTPLSHQRKLKSYKIESLWYKNYSSHCNKKCRVAKHIFSDFFENEYLLILEDLDDAGYPYRFNDLSVTGFENCLSWLATFHATFLNFKVKDLWENGCYWHLDTRPDEFKALKNKRLIQLAPILDQCLKQCKYKTLVHGDAKVTNFCFNKDQSKVSAVDFQYIGSGPGIKDLIYLMSSCLSSDQCESLEKHILDTYFQKLKSQLINLRCPEHFEKIENEWRKLYYVAWGDFIRFLEGWSPNHWKLNQYNQNIIQTLIKQYL